jgi:ribosome recycling factor
MTFDEIKIDIEARMTASVGTAKAEMSGIRAGRASPSMLDSIKIEAYGQKMNINQLGNITTPDSRTINVDIWDQSNVEVVDRAIRESDLGINPVLEGNLIRLPLPQLTEERRVEFMKIAGKISENTKIAIRNVRRDGIEKVKKLEKEKSIGQDESKKNQGLIDQIATNYTNEIEVIFKSKEEDLKKI